jgi:uncharacterized membrane protein
MSQFVSTAFSDRASADNANRALRKLGTERMMIYRSAVLSKNSEGRIFMLDRVEEGSKATMVAALIGALAGFSTGLEAAIAGAAGGALFGISAELTNRDASNRAIYKISQELARDQFAIFAEIASQDLESRMEELGGTILRSTGA